MYYIDPQKKLLEGIRKDIKMALVLSLGGCKHGKEDKKRCSNILNHNFLGQRPKSSSKALFKLDFFS